MSYTYRGANSSYSRALDQDMARIFLQRVYFIMSIGLMITGAVAWYCGDFNQAISIKLAPYMFPLIILQFGMVIGLSFFIQKMSKDMAKVLFILYSFTMGLTLSTIFLIYTQGSIFSTFLTCSALFASVATYGAITKKDLTGVGHFLGMGLWGLIIASVVNMFIHSTFMEQMITYIGVIIFTGLTAYDTQKLLKIGATLNGANDDIQEKSVIMGALTLYLDFINLFLMLLRILGNRRS